MLDDNSSTWTKVDCWMTIGSTQLYSSDRSCIRSSEWLNDRVIFAAEELLKQQHPHISGLQNPILQLTGSFEIMKKPFVQILNHAGNHWITISTIDCEPGSVFIFDSMNSLLTKELQMVVADLLHLQDHQHIVLKHVKMQYQIGSNDCGLFAIASACALCNEFNPAKMKFEQSIMRQHLLKAFQDKELTPFPHKKSRQQAISIIEKKVRIYCICRKPDSGGKMILCSNCKEWFHCACVKVVDNIIFESNWLCDMCR